MTQYNIGRPSQSIWARKTNKNIQVGKEEVRLSLFENNIILYIENPTDFTKTVRIDKQIQLS